MDMPLVSIITINYNNVKGLSDTIESVIKQSSSNYEFIIIDGGSTDGSVELIKMHVSKVDYWVSEKDKGIYNAMNKGIKAANGEYLFFLNSGDLFYDISILGKCVKQLGSEDIVYGNLLINEPGKKQWIKYYPEKLLFSYFVYDSLPHSGGVFIRRYLFKNELESYDESLKIVSDWKWFLIALFKKNYSYRYIDLLIGIFDFSGISAQPQNISLTKQEKESVIQKEFSYLTDIPELLNIQFEYKLLQTSRYFNFFKNLKKILKPR